MMTTTTTEAAPRFVVRCEDGRVRHLHDPSVENGSFPNRLAAATWAEWGHCCTSRHTFERIVPAGSAGCVVLPGLDGQTLWDCECRSCVAIQRDWYRTNGDES